MWRVEVSEVSRMPLPPIDISEDEFVIGSGEGCRVRLPASAVRPKHLCLRGLAGTPPRLSWLAGHELTLNDVARGSGASGEDTAPLRVAIGNYRLHISRAPAESIASPPQRTESLARELIRNIMGGAAPRLLIEAGPAIGSSRTLAPPPSRLTLGRGDEADWVILDEDLSRVHAALWRTWDGVRIVDLGSKNGTIVDGVAVPVGDEGRVLRDGARIALGEVVVRYRDEADASMATAPPTHPTPVLLDQVVMPDRSSALVWGGLAVAVAAVVAAFWLLWGG